MKIQQKTEKEIDIEGIIRSSKTIALKPHYQEVMRTQKGINVRVA